MSSETSQSHCRFSETCVRKGTCCMDETGCLDAMVFKEGLGPFVENMERLSDDYLITLLRKRNYTGEIRKTFLFKV